MFGPFERFLSIGPSKLDRTILERGRRGHWIGSREGKREVWTQGEVQMKIGYNGGDPKKKDPTEEIQTRKAKEVLTVKMKAKEILTVKMKAKEPRWA